MEIDPDIRNEICAIAELLYDDNPNCYGPSQYQFDRLRQPETISSRAITNRYTRHTDKRHWAIVLVACGLQPAPFASAREATKQRSIKKVLRQRRDAQQQREMELGEREWLVRDLGGRRVFRQGLEVIPRRRCVMQWDHRSKSYVPGSERIFFEIK